VQNALWKWHVYKKAGDEGVVREIILKWILKEDSIMQGPPLWSSGQSSWVQIRRPGFDFRHYQKKVVGLERVPLSLVSTTEELLDRKVASPV
jgi:hypothetical protein